jgi:hypothetical protein
MELCERLILTDCDGVILDWNSQFHTWVTKKGHKMVPGGDEQYRIGYRYGLSKEEGRRLVREFNNSSWIGYLPVYKDAAYYLDLLYRKHGFRFRVITSLSTDPYSQELRKENLHRIFGYQMFEYIDCLETGSDKDQALEPYRDSGCYWVEDSILNAQCGRDLGLNTFLMKHPHNQTRCPDGVRLVPNWAEIYRHITGQI